MILLYNEDFFVVFFSLFWLILCVFVFYVCYL